jgi:hypothetical protein
MIDPWGSDTSHYYWQHKKPKHSEAGTSQALVPHLALPIPQTNSCDVSFTEQSVDKWDPWDKAIKS